MGAVGIRALPEEGSWVLGSAAETASCLPTCEAVSVILGHCLNISQCAAIQFVPANRRRAARCCVLGDCKGPFPASGCEAAGCVCLMLVLVVLAPVSLTLMASPASHVEHCDRGRRRIWKKQFLVRHDSHC
jgi:hypothetical protein